MMRCLGRLVSLFLLLLLLAGGWLYRDDLQRWVKGIVDPMSRVRGIGEPSPAATASASEKIALMLKSQADSVILSPGEVGGLLLSGMGWNGAIATDSLQVELGDRSIHIFGRLPIRVITGPVRDFIKLPLGTRESVSLSGSLTSAGPGIAEWHFEEVSVHGIPLPAALFARVLGAAGVPSAEGRLQIPLPASIAGFRVRPSGAAFYRRGRP